MEKDVVSCFDEVVVACLDEDVVICLDKNNNFFLHVAFLLAHPLAYIEVTLGGMNKIG